MKHRRPAELKLLSALPRGRWVSALQLAKQMGWPWRVVARGLKRLSATGEVSTNVTEWRSKRSRIRQTTIYRTETSEPPAKLPEWLSRPPAPVIGARVVRFEEDGEE